MSVHRNHPQLKAQIYFEKANFWGETLTVIGINTRSFEQWNVRRRNGLEMYNEWDGQVFSRKLILENV